MLAFIQYLEIMVQYIKGATITLPENLITTPPLANAGQFIAQTTMQPIRNYKQVDLSLAELSVVYNNEASRDNVSAAQKERKN